MWPRNAELIPVTQFVIIIGFRIERGAILCRGNELTVAELPEHLANFTAGPEAGNRPASLAEMEKNHIRTVLARSPSIDEAARVLGIDPATLWRKRKKYHID